MKTWTGDEKEVLELLKIWRGADAQVWEYTCGHGILLVRVFRPQLRLSLFIQCKDCRTIRFPSMGWKDVNLSLRRKPNPQQNDEDYQFEVADGDRFYAACWGIYLLESEKPVFIDWPPDSRKSSANHLLI